jgi:PAS domain S-box-containing protein
MKIVLLFFFLFVSIFAKELSFTNEEIEFIKNHKPIKIASIKSYIPFSYEKNNNKIGLTHDLLDLISKKSGLKFEKTNGSWSTIFKKFKNKEVDIISEISYKKDREEYTVFTEPYYEVPIGVFTNGLIKYEGKKSLEGKRIGILKGSFFIQILKDIKDVEIVELESEKEKLFYLLNNQVDLIISNAMTENYTYNLMYKDVKLSGFFENEQISKEDLRFGIQKENKILSSIFLKTFESISLTEMIQLKKDWIYSNKNLHTKAYLTIEEKNFIEDNVIKIGIESSKPYIFFNEKQNDIDGFYSDILKLVLEKTGLKVEYVKDSWHNLLTDFKKGKIDLLPATFYDKKREDFGLFTKEYYKVKEYIYTKLLNYKDLTNLNNKKVAIVKGYATINKLKKKFPNIQIVETDSLAQSVSLALNEKVDALIDYHLVVENFLFENAILDLKGTPQDYLNATSVHYFSKKEQPILNSILQKGLDSILKEERTKLYNNWFSANSILSSQNLKTIKEKKFIQNHPLIKFRVRPNRAPYEFEKDGKAAGLAVDYVRESAKKMGFEVEFVVNNDPVKDAFYHINNVREKYDTLVFTVKNPDREKEFSFGIDFLSYPLMIITHKDANYVGSMSSLNNKTVVLEEGFLTNKWIKRDYPKINIINAKDTKSALEMVNSNKDLTYIGNLGVANYLRVHDKLENIKISAPSGYGDVNFSFIAPKEWPELASLLSKGFRQIAPTEHIKIQQKWFSIQEVRNTDYSLIFKTSIILFLIIIWILWWNRKLSKEKDKTKTALKELQKAKGLLEEKNKEVLISQQFLESVLDESPNPIIIKDHNNKFVLVNEALAKLYNTTKENLIGKDDSSFIDDKEMTNFYKENVKNIFDSGKSQIVYEDSKDLKTGEIRNFMSIKKPFKDTNGNQLILVIANDITEIKKLEAEKLKNQELIFQQSKTASMGEMIGNIAHQWRQPLSIISTASTGLVIEKELGVLDDNKLIDTLKTINEYTQHLSNTIETFRDYIKDTKEFKEVILQDRIKVAINIVNASFSSNFIVIKTNIETIEPIKIKLVLGELSEALINILNNSKDVLKERKIKSPWVDVQLKKQSNKAMITIEDNGGGVDEEIIERIFEPYFTTKHQSQGTGLGLHMSYKIITESLKGSIYVKNTSNGAKFFIELPL